MGVMPYGYTMGRLRESGLQIRLPLLNLFRHYPSNTFYFLIYVITSLSRISGAAANPLRRSGYGGRSKD